MTRIKGRVVTAKHVADKAGVAISTVGRALADDPRVSRSTKEKVRHAAASLDYVGNLPARMMRGGESHLVGLVIPDLRNNFYASVMQVLNETANLAGYRLILAVTDDNREVEASHIRDLARARVSGIITVPTSAPRRDSIRLLGTIPHVQLLRRNASLADNWFGIDDEAALYSATSHLIALGHRRIAYVGGETNLSTASARLSGFRKAIAQSSTDGVEMIGPANVQFGALALRSLMTLGKPPTAIVAAADSITLGIIETIEQTDIDVPGSMSLVGFGDATWLTWWRGGLTTVQLRPDELATTCGSWFFGRLRNGSPWVRDQRHLITVSSNLVVRSTTAAPGG